MEKDSTAKGFENTKEKVDVESLEVTDEDVDGTVIKQDEDVAVAVSSHTTAIG